MKDTTSNMVAPLNPLELTAAQVIRNSIQTHNSKVDGTRTQAQAGSEVHNTKYFMPNYHIVSITPSLSLFGFKNKKEWDLAKQLPHSKSVT